MARLYDRLMVEGYHMAEQLGPAYRPYMGELERATVVVADNITQHYGEHRPEGKMEEMFPWIVPPISPLFVETRPAPGVLGRDLFGWGALFVTFDLVNGDEVLAHPFYKSSPRVVYRGMPTDARWVVHSFLYIADKPKGPSQIWMFGSIPIADNGQYAASENDRLSGSTFFGLPTGVQHENRAEVTEWLHTGTRLQLPLFLALSFMHCKNVSQRGVEQGSFERQVWRKKHGRPLVRYHVLDIDPMRKVLNSEGGAQEAGLKKALHICRGHFATYTAEKPLFGNVTGTFWKPQHVRGNAKRGAVVKDYRVKAPKA